MSRVTIRLRHRDGNPPTYTADVIRGPDGEREEAFEPPFSDGHERAAVATALNCIECDIADWRSRRPALLETLQDLGMATADGFLVQSVAEAVGHRLYADLPRHAQGSIQQALRDATPASPAIIELRFQESATDLAAWPWELLRTDDGRFVFRNTAVSLVRYIEFGSRTIPVVEVERPQVLYVAARPTNLHVRELPVVEESEIRVAFDPLTGEGLLDIDALPGYAAGQSTWDALTAYLNEPRDSGPHIIHIDAHGDWGRLCPRSACGVLILHGREACDCGQPLSMVTPKGYLAFCDARGLVKWQDAEALADLLSHHTVHLVVLTACKSAVTAGDSLFDGVAPALVRAGIPAVAAMQFTVDVGMAKQFVGSFYKALVRIDHATRKLPTVTAAMARARTELANEPAAWYRPVLYLRTDDSNPEGRLFKLAPAVGAGAAAGEPAARPLPAAHAALLAAVREGRIPSDVGEAVLDAVRRHVKPCDLTEYRLGRIAEWSQEAYEVDRRFTRLTLMIDQGRDAQGQRWAAQSKPFDDLYRVLAAVPNARALVMLGDPGAGKSTLLRRLELDLAVAALGGPRPAEDAADVIETGGAMPEPTEWLPFFVNLNEFDSKVIHRNPPSAELEPSPAEWLVGRWRERYPELPALNTALGQGRVILLLDALNEMPHVDAADYELRLRAWREFLAALPPGNRAVFSCRSLNYSAGLSLPPRLSVPQVRIDRLSDEQIKLFLEKYLGDVWIDTWHEIEGKDVLDVLRIPFYTRLLIWRVAGGGGIPGGRADLLTGFVRDALWRQIRREDTLFLPETGLLTFEDHQELAGNDHPYFLPSQGPLFPRLCMLAHGMQGGADGTREWRELGDACTALADPQAERILAAGYALGVLVQEKVTELDRVERRVKFAHQLIREYFAARMLARRSDPALASVAWRADQVPERLEETLKRIALSDPLPGPETTGWEEASVLAAAMTPTPADFVRKLIEPNLALAARCAAQPDVRLSDALKNDLRQRLIDRTEDPAADLRARIAAGLALGNLGDPRFVRMAGPHGDYLMPPGVVVPTGKYTIGSKRNDGDAYPSEKDQHTVDLSEYWIAKFPVTNAEWALFIDGHGYEDEQWWETEAARVWLRGDPESVEPMKWADRKDWEDRPQGEEALREWFRVRPGISELRAKWWKQFFGQTAEDLENTLDGWYPTKRHREPLFWHDAAFNNPAQPVVGISWFEAQAYCKWLSAQADHPFHLPSEAEWEAAARGQHGRVFAYGDTFDSARCNTEETHIRRTTPIGVFPGGETPEGLADMSGNVWEWTRSLWGKNAQQPDPEFRYPYVPKDPHRENPEAPPDCRRVVRGGSWDNVRVNSRAAYRNRDIPGVQDFTLGVRLAAFSAPISLSR